jgi:hypothetical protein
MCTISKSTRIISSEKIYTHHLKYLRVACFQMGVEESHVYTFYSYCMRKYLACFQVGVEESQVLGTHGRAGCRIQRIYFEVPAGSLLVAAANWFREHSGELI